MSYERQAGSYPWALADGAVGCNGLAVSVDTAVAARARALEVSARLLSSTFAIGLALVATAGKWASLNEHGGKV